MPSSATLEAPSQTTAPAVCASLDSHLDQTGREELAQLVSMLQDDAQAFALFLVQSDFDTATRDLLLEQVEAELAPVPLQTLSLSHNSYDVPALLTPFQDADEPGVIAVVGLEETPEIVFGREEAPLRPPALAILNHGRELVRRTPHPIIIWCDPLAYSALREHAPDFFDHYGGIFRFLDAAPIAPPELSMEHSPFFSSDIMPGGRPHLSSALSPRTTSPMVREFYREQVAQLPDASPQRARALLGLGAALNDCEDAEFAALFPQAENAVVEALEIARQFDLRAEKGRAHALLSGLYKRQWDKFQQDDTALKEKIHHHLEAALEVFTEEAHPMEWATMQWIISDYETAIKGGDADIQRRAIGHFEAAQRVFTRQKEPYLWASCEMHIGDLYSRMPWTARNFKRAASHLQNALNVFSERDNVHEWAMVQMLLGNTYIIAATNSKNARSKNENAKLMRRAIAYCEAARRGFERGQEWEPAALALTYEAVAWRELPTGNRREHLRRSVDCLVDAGNCNIRSNEHNRAARLFYEAALTLIDYVKLTRTSGALEEARRLFETAHKIYLDTGDQDNADDAQSKVESVNQFLRENAPPGAFR